MIKPPTEVVPFDQIITDGNGNITSYTFTEFPELNMNELAGIFIHEMFEEWLEKDHHLILASKNNNWFLLLRKQEGENFRFLVTEGSYIYDLEQRVKELNKSNRELDAIIETSYDGIYITDNQGNTLRTNSAIERITGIPKHYYIGKNMKELIKRGILEESVSLKVLEKNTTVSAVQRNFNGKETLLTGSPIYNEDGEIEKVVTNIRDLSELNELNEELKKVKQLNKEYREELARIKGRIHHDPEVIIKSEKMIEIYEIVDRIAGFDTTILILGETGVGKDVLVRHVYRASSRFEKGQFVKVNCGAIPKDLLESELFGYEGGAFSGANKAGKMGMFELADHGVLFLDEVGELPLDLQVKLLRAIQEKEILRIGGTKVKKVDVRLIAATNRDLKEMVKKGLFREDLYYRLNVVPISVPPLRERKDDILPLLHHFIERYSEKYGVTKVLDRELQNFFYHYEWPGNVRELSNLCERLILTVQKERLTISDLPDEYKKDLELLTLYDYEKERSLKETVELAEKAALKHALEHYGTTYEIAKKLRTSQATVVRKLHKYNLV